MTENIRATIGIEYELLVWDNREAKRGLCEVYNSMAARARFPYICFLHEDILFTTDNWGGILADLFRTRPGAGIIGIAGGKYKSRTYSGWYSGQQDLDFINITHRINGRDEKITQPRMDRSGEHQAVCVDGVLIACRKKAWEEVRFDEAVLKGFHFYDIDFSLRASFAYEVWVTMKIDIIHITKGGDYGDNWVREAILYHDHYRKMLPYYDKNAVSEERVAALEVKVAAQWLDWLKAHKISWTYKWKWLTSQGLYKWPTLWYPILLFVLYQPLGLRRLHARALKRNYKAP